MSMIKVFRSHWPLLCMLVAFSVLTLMQWQESLWLDETTTAKVAKRSLAYYFSEFAPTDFHPPLYYLTTKGFTQLVGVNDFSLRIPSLLAGMLTLLCVYAIAKKLNSKQADIAAGLASCSPLLLYYAFEARMYALTAFLVAASLLALLNKKMFAFAMLAMSSYFTHYFALSMIPVYAYIVHRDKISGKFLVASIVPFAAWLPMLSKQLAFASDHLSPAWASVIGALTFKNVALVPLKFLWGRIGLDPLWLYAGVSVVVVYLWLYVAASLRKSKPQVFKLLFLWLTVPIALTLAVAVFSPVMQYFRLLFVLPGLVLLTALGIEQLRSIKARTGALMLAFSISLFSWQTYVGTPRYHRENWKEAISFIELQARPSDSVVFSFPGIPDPWLHYSRSQVVALGMGDLRDHINLRSPRIFYVEYARDLFDPQESIRQKLEQAGYGEIGFRDFNGVGNVRIFERKQVFAVHF